MKDPDAAFTALEKIAAFLSASPNEEDHLSGLGDILEEETGMLRVTLLLLSACGEGFVLESTPLEGAEEANRIEYRKGEGIIGRVLETGRSKVVPLIAQEPAFLGRIHARPAEEVRNCGFICVPVKFGNETVGALAADIPLSDDRCLFDDEKFLRVVAGIISHDVRLRRQSALMNQALKRENQRLQSQYGVYQPENMIGCSDKMRDVFSRIAQVADTDATVLIRGESGTGKELVASAIHYGGGGKKSDRPFVRVNCAALSEHLLESELFGHRRGAFTGALESRQGRVAEAEGGTLFLDEIGDFSPAIQVKLLRLLQEKEYSVVGDNAVRKANVRFICATNRDLEKAVEDKSFRLDLYYRINVFPVFLPPLRERKEDILPLANHFVEKYAALMRKEVRRISTTAIDLLMSYDWPGNVRELENCVQHGVLVCRGDAMQGSDLPPTLAMPENAASIPAGAMRRKTEQLELDMLTDALKRTGGNVAAAARELGVTARMARYKIVKFGVKLNRFHAGGTPPAS